jgi:hypothetical protein
MIVPTSNLFKLAYGKYAIGAYNINNLEQALGLFKGCIDSQAPFIIQLSKGARKYADKGMLEVIIRKAEEIYADAVFAVHLDHGDEATCYDSIESGFYSSVMIDASHEPFEENVAITKRVVEHAHAKGLSVEAYQRGRRARGGRRGVPAGGAAGGNQDQHGHRRAASLDSGTSGVFSATTPNSSTSDLPAKSLWRSTPSLSLARAKNLRQRASYHSFARRSPENSLLCTVTG